MRTRWIYLTMLLVPGGIVLYIALWLLTRRHEITEKDMGDPDFPFP
jgi:phage shock protein PspC (stress-responsive transcriptional regulator)